MRPRLPDSPPTTEKKAKIIIWRRQNNHSVELLHFRWHGVCGERLQRKICSRKIWLSRHQKKGASEEDELPAGKREGSRNAHTPTHTHRAIVLFANATLMTETDGVKLGSDTVTLSPLCASQYEDEMEGWMDGCERFDNGKAGQCFQKEKKKQLQVEKTHKLKRKSRLNRNIWIQKHPTGSDLF